MWPLYIWILSMILVAPLLTYWRISTGKVTILDVFGIIILTLASPLGLIAWMFECGVKITIWEKYPDGN